MENPILQRLRFFIKSRGMTIKIFCQSIETPEGSINNMFSRDANPSTELIIKILNVYTLSANWLLIGFGEMEIERELPENQIHSIMGRYLKEANKKLTPEKKEKKEPESTTEMLKFIQELSAENALLKERNKVLEENKNGYINVAEPIIKYGK